MAWKDLTASLPKVSRGGQDARVGCDVPILVVIHVALSNRPEPETWSLFEMRATDTTWQKLVIRAE